MRPSTAPPLGLAGASDSCRALHVVLLGPTPTVCDRHVVDLNQNTYLIANCQMRGVPTDEVMRPKVAGLFSAVCGLPRLN